MCVKSNSTRKLNTGAEMPIISLGTWKSSPGQVEHAVEHALKVGYKGIDTAAAYCELLAAIHLLAFTDSRYAANEKEVGEGIAASGVDRSTIFLTTKLNNTDHKDPEQALFDSLKKLNTPYIDLCKLYLPSPENRATDGAHICRAHALGAYMLCSPIVCREAADCAMIAGTHDRGRKGRQVAQLARHLEEHGTSLQEPP